MLKRYISEIDQFLQNFDKENPNYSKARLEEAAKHKAIAAARDHVAVGAGPCAGSDQTVGPSPADSTLS